MVVIRPTEAHGHGERRRVGIVRSDGFRVLPVSIGINDMDVVLPMYAGTTYFIFPSSINRVFVTTTLSGGFGTVQESTHHVNHVIMILMSDHGNRAVRVTMRRKGSTYSHTNTTTYGAIYMAHSNLNVHLN